MDQSPKALERFRTRLCYGELLGMALSGGNEAFVPYEDTDVPNLFNVAHAESVSGVERERCLDRCLQVDLGVVTGARRPSAA